MNSQQGILFRNAGMKQVRANLPAQWRDAYRIYAELFLCGKAGGDTFMGEDLRVNIAQKIGEPHHPNAWGSMAAICIRRWMDAGKIERIAYQPCKSIKNNACVRPVYQVKNTKGECHA